MDSTALWKQVHAALPCLSLQRQQVCGSVECVRDCPTRQQDTVKRRLDFEGDLLDQVARRGDNVFHACGQYSICHCS
jgi:hypothetical protein